MKIGDRVVLGGPNGEVLDAMNLYHVVMGMLKRKDEAV